MFYFEIIMMMRYLESLVVFYRVEQKSMKFSIEIELKSIDTFIFL